MAPEVVTTATRAAGRASHPASARISCGPARTTTPAEHHDRGHGRDPDHPRRRPGGVLPAAELEHRHADSRTIGGTTAARLERPHRRVGPRRDVEQAEAVDVDPHQAGAPGRPAGHRAELAAGDHPGHEQGREGQGAARVDPRHEEGPLALDEETADRCDRRHHGQVGRARPDGGGPVPPRGGARRRSRARRRRGRGNEPGGRRRPRRRPHGRSPSPMIPPAPPSRRAEP